MEEPITLVVVDCQYDFCHPAGTLYVKGAETAVENILHFISTTDNIAEVIFTVDWHQAKDDSFAPQGGPWPPHCIRFSQGAQIDPRLVQRLLGARHTFSGDTQRGGEGNRGVWGFSIYLGTRPWQIPLGHYDRRGD